MDFLPEDKAYVSSSKPISLGRKIASGRVSAVYRLSGTKNFVMKIPMGFTRDKRSAAERQSDIKYSDMQLQAEANLYTKYKLNSLPLFIPTKIINIGTTPIYPGEHIGLLRTIVRPIIDLSVEIPMSRIVKPKTAEIEKLRQDLITLTNLGFAFGDELQVGIDRTHRIMLYDVDSVERISPSRAKVLNEDMWRNFLYYINHEDFNNTLVR